ncbi:hypothetical protein LSM04_000452 [Trypanosoma melophagium]|uniref:uncharacterized protein n=1 Tax=Trypanosoma melophagium TaxID=715481 RepID=UPI003519E7F8|nr:hypothetical protein LSM04_000452 [Trypanosoma melophagium]
MRNGGSKAENHVERNNTPQPVVENNHHNSLRPHHRVDGRGGVPNQERNPFNLQGGKGYGIEEMLLDGGDESFACSTCGWGEDLMATSLLNSTDVTQSGISGGGHTVSISQSIAEHSETPSLGSCNASGMLIAMREQPGLDEWKFIMECSSGNGAPSVQENSLSVPYLDLSSCFSPTFRITSSAISHGGKKQQGESLQQGSSEMSLRKKKSSKVNAIPPQDKRSVQSSSPLADSFSGEHLGVSPGRDSGLLNASSVPAHTDNSALSYDGFGVDEVSPSGSVFVLRGNGGKVWRCKKWKNDEKLPREHDNRRVDKIISPEIPINSTWDMNRVNTAVILSEKQTDDRPWFKVLSGNRVVELLTPSPSRSAVERSRGENIVDKKEDEESLEKFEFDEVIQLSPGQKMEFKKFHSFSKLLELFFSGYKTALVLGSNISPPTIAEDFILYAIQSSLTGIMQKKRDKITTSFDLTLRISAIRPSENKVCDLMNPTSEFQEIVIGQGPLHGLSPLGMKEIDLQLQIASYVAVIRQAFDRRSRFIGESTILLASLALKQVEKTSRVSVLLSSMQFILANDPVSLVKGGFATNITSHILQTVLDGACATLLVGCLNASMQYREWVTLIAMQRNSKHPYPLRLTLDDLLCDTIIPELTATTLVTARSNIKKGEKAQSMDLVGFGDGEGVNPFEKRTKRRSSVVISDPGGAPVMMKPVPKSARSIKERGSEGEVKNQEKDRGGRDITGHDKGFYSLGSGNRLGTRKKPSRGDERDSKYDEDNLLKRKRCREQRRRQFAMVFPGFVETSEEDSPVQSRVSDSFSRKEKSLVTSIGVSRGLGCQKSLLSEGEDTSTPEEKVVSLTKASWDRVSQRRNSVRFSEGGVL